MTRGQRTPASVESVELREEGIPRQDGGLYNPGYVTEPSDPDGDPSKETSAEIDPWALPELNVQFVPWSELTGRGKLKRALCHYFLKLVLLLACLYLFICSIGFLGDAFKLLGGKAAGEALADSEILSNPVAGLMIGVLATVLLQSSSTTTSLIVSMVAEQILTVDLAIPIAMGANIGTSVTNTIVSLGQITNKDDFRRAFAGATVHDMFNWMTVLVLLPLEIVSGYLRRISKAIVDSMQLETNKDVSQDYLSAITKPFTKLVIQIDKDIIKKIATGDEEAKASSIIQHCCDKKPVYRNVTVEANVNGSLVQSVQQVEDCHKRCTFLFESVSRDGGWSDTAVGIILLLISLVILCACLVAIVKILNSLLKGQMAVIIRKFVNAEFPGACRYFTGYLAILIGGGLTILVQSSSIFTSSITPLVGIGVISLDRMYPLTLGSNIGTTTTGILAALSQDSETIANALQIAFCHLFFNISGILLFYPVPKLRFPIPLAKYLGTQTARYRWFALVYLVVAFFILPGLAFALSSVSWIAFAAVFIPIAAVALLVGTVKLLQVKKPSVLPKRFRTWKWLPLFLRSLQPYDRFFLCVTGNCLCCRKCGCMKGMYEDDENEADDLKAEVKEGKQDSKDNSEFHLRL